MTTPMPADQAAKRRPYTTGDIAFIRDNYYAKGADAVAKNLGRTARSIRATAWMHGIGGKVGRPRDE